MAQVADGSSGMIKATRQPPPAQLEAAAVPGSYSAQGVALHRYQLSSVQNPSKSCSFIPVFGVERHSHLFFGFLNNPQCMKGSICPVGACQLSAIIVSPCPDRDILDRQRLRVFFQSAPALVGRPGMRSPNLQR